MAAYTTNELEQRLVESAAAWIATDATIAARCVVKERDVDAEITPKTTAAKKLRLIVVARDEGRTANYASIRNLRLSFEIRGNSKTEEGEADGMHEVAAAVERMLDDHNLITALDSAAKGVRVMHAARRPGCGFAREGMIRRQLFEVEVKAVASERAA